MAQANIGSLRRAAIAGIVGATATTISGLIVQAVVQPSTAVSDQQWSYPWSSSALVPFSILAASLHLLVFVGVLGFGWSRLAGRSRAALGLSFTKALPTGVTIYGLCLLGLG